jgi:hypothetical protein
MKLTRRSFLGFLSSLVATPLVAKDMGDFDFLPPQRVLPPGPEVPYIEPVTEAPIRAVTVGELRYNINTDQMEVYTSTGWRSLQNG